MVLSGSSGAVGGTAGTPMPLQPPARQGGLPAFLPPQQMPYIQYPSQYPQFQPMAYQQYAHFGQQSPQIMPGPPPTQDQPLVAQPAQLGATNVVRPKRKKKKQVQVQQPGQVPPQMPVQQPGQAPQMPVQPMMAYAAAAQVPQVGLGIPASHMAVPSTSVATPHLMSQLSDGSAQVTPPAIVQAKAKKSGKC
jgi:hypothetical protein